jgi:hypothetical protein
MLSLVGVFLLLPGLCALAFSSIMFSEAPNDPALIMLGVAGLLVAAGGIALIVFAVRRKPR